MIRSVYDTKTNNPSPICIGPMVPAPIHVKNSEHHELAAAKSNKLSLRRLSDRFDDDDVITVEHDDLNESAPEDLQIVTINACGHSFHAKCLSSWFLMRRYDCPVCRAVYYHGLSAVRRSSETSLSRHAGSWHP